MLARLAEHSKNKLLAIQGFAVLQLSQSITGAIKKESSTV